MLGKFQTDCVEFRFGLYRRLSGTNYRISVQQLRESEKKLRVAGLLRVISASRGKISFRQLLTDDDLESTSDNIDVSDFAEALLLCDDLTITEQESQSLVFIAGYVGFKAVKKLQCDLCKLELVMDKTLRYDTSNVAFTYLAEINRGGLSWPTDFLVEIVAQVYLVFQVLISKQYETQFIACTSQKSVLSVLSLDRVIEFGTVAGECTCGTKMIDIAKLCLSYVSNICLNNYCKRFADRSHSSKCKVQMKLSTYSRK